MNLQFVHINRIYTYVYTAPRKSWYVHLKKDIQQSNCIRNHFWGLQVYEASVADQDSPSRVRYMLSC